MANTEAHAVTQGSYSDGPSLAGYPRALHVRPTALQILWDRGAAKAVPGA